MRRSSLQCLQFLHIVGVLDHTSNKRTFDINIELPRDFNEHLRSLKMLQNKSTTSWLSYSFSHHRTKHSSSSSKWKAPTILISLLIDCYGRKKITTYIFIFANLNAFLLKLCDFWLLPFHFTSHWGTAKSISCLVRRIPIRGPAWLCLGGNGVSRPQFPKWSFTAVPFFWALQIRLPRSFFTWSSPRRKNLWSSVKKNIISKNLKNSMKLGHFRTNSTQVFVDLKKQTWKKSLNKLAPSSQQERHQSQPWWLINGRRLHLSEQKKAWIWTEKMVKICIERWMEINKNKKITKYWNTNGLTRMPWEAKLLRLVLNPHHAAILWISSPCRMLACHHQEDELHF